jgi:uncharacterized protein (UPF0303 family)
VVQEEALRFTRFSEDEAWALGCLMREGALRRRLPLVIDIRHEGRVLFFTALPGTAPDNAEWVRRKSNVVFRFGRCSYRMGRELALKGVTLEADRVVDPLHYAPHGGSFPIHISGTGIIGAITVSGIPQRDDHNFTVEAIAAFLKVPYTEIMLGPEAH